jgi:hypothetical protein
MIDFRNAHKILIAKSEDKEFLGRHTPCWEYNIKMHPKETGLAVVAWIHLAQDGVFVISVMKQGSL